MAKDFWTQGNENASIRFRMEHGLVAGMEGDDLVIAAGNEELLPPWPPDLPEYVCGACGTEVKEHGDAGWRHEKGFKERGGCPRPRPRQT